MESLQFAWCAGPAGSLAAWPMHESRPERSPATDCLRNAQAALAVGRLDAALGWFRHAAALDPDLHFARLGAALCLLQEGREGEAAIELGYAYAASREPGDVDASLARLYVLGGQMPAACEALALAARQDKAWLKRARSEPVFAPLLDHPLFLSLTGQL